MGKNQRRLPRIPDDESHFSSDGLPVHPTTPSTPIVDTHTHLLATFSAYKRKYPAGAYGDAVWDFVRGMYAGRNVRAIVDVWCEAPVQRAWRELADSALSAQDRAERWGGIEYWFVMGVHPHEARLYDDAVERSILEAMTHPRCVGWGEIGLDYHYDNSPREIQQRVFARQLHAAVQLGKPLTIHTREAEEDTERILKEHVPPNHKIHVHCFTDSPAFAHRLLDHFPNLYIGITGVISYSTNLNTSTLVRQMAATATTSGTGTGTTDVVDSDAERSSSDSLRKLRILLETDAPFMVPSNMYASLPALKGQRLPFCHTAMIPWVADFTAGVVRGENVMNGVGARDADADANRWEAADVMRRANENATLVYGI